MIDPVQALVGFVVLLIAVGALLYIFYARTNAVEKTGYGALVMLSIISLMIPVFWIMETNGQAQADVQQRTNSVQQGAALYSKYCFTCHGLSGMGGQGPKLNGNTAVNSLSDTDLLRILDAGIPNASNPSQLLMPAWSAQYGGPLSDPQIQYLFTLIRSADPSYMQKNGYTAATGYTAGDGFSQVPADVQQSNPSAYSTAVAQATSGAGLGQFGTVVDDTAKPTVTMDIVNTLPNVTCTPSCYANSSIKVKVGTKITWVNQSSAPHTVTAIKGLNPGSEVPNPTAFDSGLSTPIAPNGSYSYTVTMAAYNANSTHQVVYYCQFHPSMLALITIVP